MSYYSRQPISFALNLQNIFGSTIKTLIHVIIDTTLVPFFFSRNEFRLITSVQFPILIIEKEILCQSPLKIWVGIFLTQLFKRSYNKWTLCLCDLIQYKILFVLSILNDISTSTEIFVLILSAKFALKTDK